MIETYNKGHEERRSLLGEVDGMLGCSGNFIVMYTLSEMSRHSLSGYEREETILGIWRSMNKGSRVKIMVE